MTPRRICFVITGLQGGGAETMLVHLLRRLDRTRYQPTVIALMEEGRLRGSVEGLDVPFETLGLAQGRPTLGALVRLIGRVRAAKPDLIQGWMYHGNLGAMLAKPFTGVPVCWCTQNSFDSFDKEKPLTRWTVRFLALLSGWAARSVYVSHASLAQHEALGFDQRHGVVIPNGADADVFKPAPEARADVRRELGAPVDAPLIGYVARFHPQKDHATFLRAALALSARRPDARFVLVGRGCTPDNAALTTQGAALGPRLHLVGERTDLPRLNAAFDVATSTSSFGEALSLAIAEAMACGVPCVVTDVGDSARLVGETGVAARAGDHAAIAAGWERLIGPEGKRLGPKARERAIGHYSVASIVNTYTEMYDSVLGATR